NVRELKNCLEAAFNFCKNNEYITLKDVIELIDFADTTSQIEKKEKSMMGKIDEILENVFIEALKNNNYNKKAAALSLGIPLSTFYRKIKQLKI
ncbi:MAG: hypothetical protein N2596_04780, partial [Syntrophorhabdaceae bacterium]|nr:hypothetical protein [Syntrophorhabdaceae bacterium]